MFTYLFKDLGLDWIIKCSLIFWDGCYDFDIFLELWFNTKMRLCNRFCLKFIHQLFDKILERIVKLWIQMFHILWTVIVQFTYLIIYKVSVTMVVGGFQLYGLSSCFKFWKIHVNQANQGNFEKSLRFSKSFILDNFIKKRLILLIIF